MSGHKHTPGPWEHCHASDGRCACGRIYSTSTDTEVASLASDEDAAQGDERVANAHLIAAAPDMLDALEGILAHYVALAESGDAGFWNPEMEPQVLAARAAIKKARGEK